MVYSRERRAGPFSPARRRVGSPGLGSALRACGLVERGAQSLGELDCVVIGPEVHDLMLALLFPAATRADGVAEVISCEADSSPPEPRGSDTAARLIQMARQKAKEGKDDEAIRWALLCKLDVKDQDAIKRDSAAVLQYLKQ